MGAGLTMMWIHGKHKPQRQRFTSDDSHLCSDVLRMLLKDYEKGSALLKSNLCIDIDIRVLYILQNAYLQAPIFGARKIA